MGKLRPIRSYVMRGGRITAAQKRALDGLLNKYSADEKILPQAQQVHLEIGFGDGENLINMALMNPHINFIGCEVHRPGIGRLLLNIKNQKINNIKVANGDAVEFLRDKVCDNSLNAIHLYFPDPWPKKRHHKRRIMQPAFVDLIIARLVVGGKFYFATDWQNYAEQTEELLSQVSQLQRIKQESPGRVVTKFARRGLKIGNRIFNLNYQRV